MANLDAIVKQLEAERDRIDSAIKALQGVGQTSSGSQPSIAALFFQAIGWVRGTGSAYCFSDLQVLRVRTHLFTRPNFRFSVLRCAIQAASGRTAVAGCPPVLRATDMPTHSVLSHIKGQNARDSRFESWDAPPNSPPPELFTT